MRGEETQHWASPRTSGVMAVAALTEHRSTGARYSGSPTRGNPSGRLGIMAAAVTSKRKEEKKDEKEEEEHEEKEEEKEGGRSRRRRSRRRRGRCGVGHQRACHLSTKRESFLSSAKQERYRCRCRYGRHRLGRAKTLPRGVRRSDDNVRRRRSGTITLGRIIIS